MANKIISIGSAQTAVDTKKYTYRDVNMVSDINILNRRPNADDDKFKQLFFLLQEYPIEEQKKHILTEHDFMKLAAYSTFDREEYEKALEEYKKHGMFVVSKLDDVKAVANSLRNIFTWIPGERVINPEFGSKLHYYLYEGITELNKEQILSEIRASVSRWEPRANIQEVIDISEVTDTEENTVAIRIVYSIDGLEDEQFYFDYVRDQMD